jgi:hypothetical protein
MIHAGAKMIEIFDWPIEVLVGQPLFRFETVGSVSGGINGKDTLCPV